MNENEEEMSIEEVVEENNILLNTLIDHLIEKNVISEDEFLEKLNSMSAEAEEEDDGEDSESESEEPAKE